MMLCFIKSQLPWLIMRLGWQDVCLSIWTPWQMIEQYDAWLTSLKRVALIPGRLCFWPRSTAVPEKSPRSPPGAQFCFAALKGIVGRHFICQFWAYLVQYKPEVKIDEWACSIRAASAYPPAGCNWQPTILKSSRDALLHLKSVQTCGRASNCLSKERGGGCNGTDGTGNRNWKPGQP